ncbi:hypothetical protein LEL_08834 [Akanthomyces lecanii RCEF 1005]|uniref:SnoaL-like domain-containing protein n=1 Tax=Akanthomyces lecanii RCEF 1005 TaxID=1081108 RepID=A0A168DV88_CORDF|nr:hypothetical protein LEL_08834 [Akanthomyces lecanii RCEF 1005]
MQIPTHALIAITEAFIGNISSRSWDNLPGFFAPDATWWISGNAALLPPGFPCGDGLAKDRLPNLPGLMDQFTHYEYKIVNIVGQDNRVMVEGQAIGDGPGALHYVNNITSSYEFERPGKIVKVREYPDSTEILWVMQQLQNQSKST